jgi:hypothetical protein
MAATNRELRQAFLEGQLALIEYWRQHPGTAYPLSAERWQMAEKRFPKEKKTQPRKVVVGRFTYWFDGRELWAVITDGGAPEQVAHPAGGGPKWWSLEDVKKLGELAANPTEEVEVEDS